MAAKHSTNIPGISFSLPFRKRNSKMKKPAKKTALNDSKIPASSQTLTFANFITAMCQQMVESRKPGYKGRWMANICFSRDGELMAFVSEFKGASKKPTLKFHSELDEQTAGAR
jgi:hypothetical protein